MSQRVVEKGVSIKGITVFSGLELFLRIMDIPSGHAMGTLNFQIYFKIGNSLKIDEYEKCHKSWTKIVSVVSARLRISHHSLFMKTMFRWKEANLLWFVQQL